MLLLYFKQLICRYMWHQDQSLNFQVKCNCQHAQITQEQVQQEVDLQQLYSRFSKTLEDQLKKLDEQKNAQIDQLNNQLFVLRNSIQKLQIRNKRDLDGEKQLRIQYNILAQKLKETMKDPRVVREVEIVQKIKQIQVSNGNQQLQQEIAYWKKKSEAATIDLYKIKMEKDLIGADNQNLREQISQNNKIIQHLKMQVQQLNDKLNQKDRAFDKLNQQNIFLKNNKEIIVQTKHIFPDFKPAERIRTETKVETVFVQKPVERVVFVDVERRIKQFIQPERPLVNRIINCQSNKKCKCDDENVNVGKYETQITYLNSVVDKLQGNINEYKSQRQKLVQVIQNKNSELNSIQNKFRLYGGISTSVVRTNGEPLVNVTVTKLREEEKPSSQKRQTILKDKQTKKKY